MLSIEELPQLGSVQAARLFELFFFTHCLGSSKTPAAASLLASRYGMVIMFSSNQAVLIMVGAAVLTVGLAFIPHGKAYDPVKRIVDLILSIMAILVLSPIILIAALAIKLDSKGPVFYPADRVGAKERRIKVWKLRTMVPEADRASSITSGNDSRITRVGKFLRATKLDELPQLFNIIFGTMTIAGPRPESTNIVERYYTQKDKELFDSPPGLTCPGTLYYYIHDEDNKPPVGMSVEEYYAQISLRTKLAADLHYVRHRCLAYDIRLMVLTIVIIFSKLLGRKPTLILPTRVDVPKK